MSDTAELAAARIGASTEAPDAIGTFRIWPGSGTAPGTESWDWAESTMQIPWTTTPRRLTRNVVIPSVTAFLPEPGRATGAAMVVVPGGAFHFLMIDHEGYDLARWLAARGIAAFVLKYRLGRSPDSDADLLAFRNGLHSKLPAPGRSDLAPPASATIDPLRRFGEDDGRQAIRFVRRHAAQWGIAPDRIGIIGFSAGGAVSIGAAAEHDAASRPDFAVGIYPAYRGDLTPPASAMPLFLATADDDASVAPLSTTRLAEAWHKAGGSVELHVFANGAHGFGVGEIGKLSDRWMLLFEHWLMAYGFA